MSRRIALALLLGAGVCSCATEGAGGGGPGVDFLDCATDYCVGYDNLGLRRLYIRTPAGAAGAPRGRITSAAGRGASTQIVTRASVPSPGASRMGPIPARPSSTSPGAGRRP